MRVSSRRADIEDFIRGIVAQIAVVRGAGAEDAAAIADALNARGITTRKGRRWTPATVAKFLSSPGAKRFGAKPLDDSEPT